VKKCTWKIKLTPITNHYFFASHSVCIQPAQITWMSSQASHLADTSPPHIPYWLVIVIWARGLHWGHNYNTSKSLNNKKNINAMLTWRSESKRMKRSEVARCVSHLIIVESDRWGNVMHLQRIQFVW
jgi:hypothetical protein